MPSKFSIVIGQLISRLRANAPDILFDKIPDFPEGLNLTKVNQLAKAQVIHYWEEPNDFLPPTKHVSIKSPYSDEALFIGGPWRLEGNNKANIEAAIRYLGEWPVFREKPPKRKLATKGLKAKSADEARDIEIKLPPLTNTASAAKAIIRAKKGAGLYAKEILKTLAKKGISIKESSFRKHIVPQLKAHGIKNGRARGGYYDSTCLNGM
jgi:hypothetical protein